jgi:hypothetical protein
MRGKSTSLQCLIGADGKVGNGIQQCAVEVKDGKALWHDTFQLFDRSF